MHSLIHVEYANATARSATERRGGWQQHRPGHPPSPKRARGWAAYGLASAARRLDRERARCAIA